MRYAILALFALVAMCPQASAEHVKKVWALAVPETQASATFQYRVIQPSPWEVQLLEDGRPGRVLSVVSTNKNTAPTVTATTQQHGPSDRPYFTLSGNMALFVPNREGGIPYIRAFDPGRGTFDPAGPYIFKSQAEFVVGENHVAAFDGPGPRHLPDPSERIDLYVVSYDDNDFSSQKLWGDDQFTTVRAMDINAAGDVVAAVARRLGSSITEPWDCKLVVAQGQRVSELPLGDGVGCPTAVGISPDGHLAAVGVRNRIIIYRMEATPTPTQTTSVSVDVCLPQSTCLVQKIAVSNDGAIATWALGFQNGAPPGRWHIIAVNHAGCEDIASYEFSEIMNPRARFVRGNRLYIDAQRLHQDEEPVAAVLEFE